MFETMMIIWFAAAAVLLLLCLPIPSTRKLVLELYALALRLGLAALLIGGAVLWFRPEWTPAWVNSVVDGSPELSNILPAVGTEAFGLSAAVLITAIFLPILAALDVCRRLAGDRLCRLARVADQSTPVVVTTASGVQAATEPPRPRPVERRTPAETARK